MGIVSVIDELVSSSKVHAWAYTTAGEHGHPAKGVAIVACMDARINVESMFGLRTGDAHIIRNAGGIVTDDVLRSLLISQRLLGTRAILLLHHTDCGLMRLNESQLVPQLEREAGVKLPFTLGAFTDLDEDLRRSLALIRSFRFLVARNSVRAFVYDVSEASLREVV
jgi:carbonic anhydrase